jgi:SAM-dependent methyltransferase
MQPEFDRYAKDYAEFSRDPLRDSFAPGSRFFLARKIMLLREFFKRRAEATESASWLDVGCGQGDLLRHGKRYFGRAAGCDVSGGMLRSCEELDVRLMESPCEVPFEAGSFDLVTAVCVFHHVARTDREVLFADISRVLRRNGIFCIIEHNPFNPVTRLIVRTCPIDVEARLLRAETSRNLSVSVGMKILATEYFLYFPEWLYTKLASVEARLSSVPLGGQYAVFAQKVL